MRIRLDVDTLSKIQYFEAATHAKVKDCLVDDNNLLVFIVEQFQLKNAVGKNGVKVKALEFKFRKKIKIIEYNDTLTTFVQNVFYPLKANAIRMEGDENDVVIITPQDSKTRGVMIGRAAQNLRSAEKIVQRYFNIKEIKIE